MVIFLSQRINQGILNTLIHCKLKSDATNEDALVVRIFAEDTMADRDLEKVGLRVAMEIGFGPPLVAEFNNGIVMGFVKGRTLTYEDYADPKIMR